MSFDSQKPQIEADLHTHTVACSHAYSTVLEMAQFAAQKGLKAIAITDHAPAIPDGAHPWHFGNLRSLPPVICGVRVLHGVEANIIDFAGNLDLEERLQKELDWVIVSYHDPAREPGTLEENGAGYIGAAHNPYVDVIGHSGSEAFKYDYEAVLPIFRQTGKIVEINSHSFAARRGARENCRTIALLCKKLAIPVVVSSDAHTCFSVGDVAEAMEMLAAIDFPNELILNLDFTALAERIGQKRGRKII